jgi:hypothetical protein
MLVLAAQRGSLRTVRALLAHGAGAEGQEPAVALALAEARRIAGLDPERELRWRLEEMYSSGIETVTLRGRRDGEETMAVELLRNGVPSAGVDQHLGHAEIAALLGAQPA